MIDATLLFMNAFVGAQEHEKHYGRESWRQALQVEANWLPFRALVPNEKDAHLETALTKLRAENALDELLAALAKFSHVTEPEVRALSIPVHCT